MSHKRQVETDCGTRERTDHVSLWPAHGSCDPSLLARGAERASFLSTGTVVGGEGHFTPPLHPSYFTGHFTPERRASTIQVYQQVDRDRPRIVKYLKTNAGFREVDLFMAVGEYLQAFMKGKDGLLFETRNGTPYLHNNLEQRWLTPRLEAMGIDEKEWAFTRSAVSGRRG